MIVVGTLRWTVLSSCTLKSLAEAMTSRMKLSFTIDAFPIFGEVPSINRAIEKRAGEECVSNPDNSKRQFANKCQIQSQLQRASDAELSTSPGWLKDLNRH